MNRRPRIELSTVLVLICFVAVLSLAVQRLMSPMVAPARLRQSTPAQQTKLRIGWQEYRPGMIENLRASDQPLLIHFTAQWDISCKLPLITTLNTPEVEEAVNAGNYIPILVDWTERSDDVRRELRAFGLHSIPATVVINPRSESPLVFAPIVNKQELVDALSSRR
jgi:thiol:disulfide interchange protein